MFQNLKLQGRILWGYSVPILLSISTAILVFGTVKYVENQIIAVESATATEKTTKGIAYNLASMQKIARGYVIEKDEASLEEYERVNADYYKQTRALKQQFTNPNQQQKITELTEIGRRVDTFNRRLIYLVNSGKPEKAVRLWQRGKVRELGDRLDKLALEIEQSKQQIRQDKQEVVTSSLQLLNIIVIIGNLLSGMLALSIGLWIASIISKAVNQTVNQVATTSTEIATTVEQQERTVSQQASSVSQTTTTMEELDVSSLQSAEQAEASANGAKLALTLAENGNRAVQQTMSGMSNLKQKVGAIAEQIINLSEQTSQIGSISGLVGDLANQTNMLALNAAVEAARAGEHGKGFSVVASEIRKLADQSKKSAQDITALVADIQGAINTTVMVTDEGTKTVDQSIQLAQGTAESFTGVADAVNNVFLNSQQISLNVKQQAIAVRQVVQAMNAVNLGAKESASGIAQVKASTQQLNEAAQKLKSVI